MQFAMPLRMSIVVLGISSLWFCQVAKSEQPADPIEKAAASEDYYELLRLFVDTLDQVERNYVEDVTRRQLIESAIQGMLSKLDQHSDYISPDDLDQFKSGVESEFGGVGIQVSGRRDRPLTVISPLMGSPAYEAGVLAGDIITHIEGESTDGFSVDDAIKRIKGPVGSSVNITVRHRATRLSEEVELSRQIIRVDTVRGERRLENDEWDFFLDREKKIGYVQVSGFARHTKVELTAALDQLVDDGMSGLIVDLRFNPGGLLSSAIRISDLFISEGRIVSTEGRNQNPQTWDARRNGTYEGFPVAVLVNRFSASASEIVAACLQDHKRAVVIGERTFGKGSVQNIVELEGGRSALKLTTAGYLRPSGKNIHRFPNAAEDDEWGVRPNDGFELSVNPRLQNRLLRERRSRDVVRRGIPESPVEDESDADADVEEAVDEVLAKALEYLSEQLAKDAGEAVAAGEG